MTSQNSVVHIARFPILPLQVAPIGSLSLTTSSQERPGPPTLSVSAGWHNEIQHKIPNITFGNEAARERSNSLKGQRFFWPPIPYTSRTAPSHELAWGSRNLGAKFSSVLRWCYLDVTL